MIIYKNGDVLQNSSVSRIICHVVNNKGGFGKGFAASLAKKYPVVKNKYKEWYGMSLLYGDNKFKLGSLKEVVINDNLTIINMLCQDGYASRLHPTVIDYLALEMCLEQIKLVKPKFEIWMPKIGSGLAGGDWNKIEEIIERVLIDRKVIIYEL